MAKRESTVPVNKKEEDARYSFSLKVRDTEHFYKVVKWLNTNVGRGSDKWTMKGKIRRQLQSGAGPVETVVYIFIDEFSEDNALFVNLL